MRARHKLSASSSALTAQNPLRFRDRSFCERFYAAQQNHSVLLTTPAEYLPVIASGLLGPGWDVPTQGCSKYGSQLARLVAVLQRRVVGMKQTPGHGEPLEMPALSWHAPRCGRRGTDFILQPFRATVPPAYRNLQARCDGRNWTQAYALYSGAFFAAQLLWLPVLSRCDWWVKQDTDVIFYQDWPFDLGLWLQRYGRDASVAHTGLLPAKSCEAGILAELHRFHRSRPPAPNSMAEWCHNAKLTHVMYGNFVAYRTATFRSAAVQELSRWLYHDAGHGYFKTRWTDQAPMPALLCHGGGTTPGRSSLLTDPKILHLARMRRGHGGGGQIFRHGRAKKSQAKSSHAVAKSKAPKLE